ncbi:MAG: aldo/keto reductase [Xanthomarina gelatinilytica]|uniref:aldo/keto reductase n=1 Tax=Xanthomarina gelatinilytica TaxID=1137281 RepID=UPI003A87FAFA
MNVIELESERLKLKPLRLQHLSQNYVDWMNDVDVYKYLETGGNYTYKDLEQYLKEQEIKNILFWAIHLKSNNKHIGNIKIDPIDLELNSGEYGIMMGDKSEWGKGYAKEASLRIIEFCFEKINLSQITLGVIDRNKSAIRLYERLGFTIEKINKNSGVYQGEVCNSIRMIKKSNISKLILGTVQLGLNYGINNKYGKPTIEKAFEILHAAFDNGIRTLDTAEAYGSSQEIIGKFQKENPSKSFKIITKLAAQHSLKSKELSTHISNNSKILNTDKLYGYMFHNYQSFKDNTSFYNEVLLAKKSGLIEKSGISLYSNNEIEDIIENYSDFDFIQIPFNLFDNESKRKTILEKAKAVNIQVHTRSVFLQGLFFKGHNDLPEKLKPLKGYLEKLESIEKATGINTQTLALQYVLQKKYIDYVLIGVESVDQLMNNIEILNSEKNIPHEVIDAIQVSEEYLLNPTNWN